MNRDQYEKVAHAPGFMAALDQSGGSTAQALALYQLAAEEYHGDAEMFDVMHAMRTRIVTSPSFNGNRIFGAILFEDTIDRLVDGRRTPDYLWQVKQVVPFLKVDRGLAEMADGAQMMKPLTGLDDLLQRAVAHNVFGTKMRSVIKVADRVGVRAVVTQQFEVARRIIAAGLMPIIEPEVDIRSAEKNVVEVLLKAEILTQLDQFIGGEQVMLKLSIPTQDGWYRDLVDHPNVLRVVALSGGYTRAEASARLARNPGISASFSRALTEGLTAQQTDEEFNAALEASIASIFAASTSREADVPRSTRPQR